MSFRQRLMAILDSVRAALPYLTSRDARHQVCTEEYPDTISSRVSDDLAPRTRGFLANDLSVCTGCGDCIELCPSKALGMDSEIRVDGTVQVNRFRIDLGRCFFCSACVEICPVSSIRHTKNYEIKAHSPNSLVLEFDGREGGVAEKNAKIREKIKQIRSYEVRR